MVAKKKIVKKIVKKPISKKKAEVKKKPKKATPPKQTTEIVVRVEQQHYSPTTTDLVEPMRDGQKLTVPATWISDKQIIQMVQKTPNAHRYTRKGKGGQTFDYVTGTYVTKVLNFVFGWNWDFEVVTHGREGNQVWVQGKLTVRGLKDGQQIVKTQFGRADVKMLKAGGMVDFGNDLKAASTDALKKCASMLGIASDIYGKSDYKQETGQDVHEPVIQTQVLPKATEPETKTITLKPGQVIGPDGLPTYLCENCDIPIKDIEANYSLKLYKKRFCRECQK